MLIRNLLILEDETLKDPAKLIPRRHMLEGVIASHFDYVEMSKRALATHWVPLTANERTEFVEPFKRFLSDRYAEKVESYLGEQVFYPSERIEKNNLVVDGVSMVKNYRSQFEKIIRSDSYQGLVRRLRTRTVGGNTRNYSGR